MRKYGLAAAAASFVISGAALAAPTPTFVFTQNVYTPTATSPTAIFENFDGTPGPFTTRTVAGVGTETSTGAVSIFSGSTSISGTAVNPDTGPDNYLAIGGAGAAGTFRVDFSTPMQYFSFAFGSLDNYNTLTLNFTDGSIFLSGLGITTGNTANNTAAGTAPASFPGNVSGRLNIYGNGGSSLTSVVFGSSQAAFEIDQLAAATPEPATWGMMILGFGMAGAALRVRRRKASIAFA